MIQQFIRYSPSLSSDLFQMSSSLEILLSYLCDIIKRQISDRDFFFGNSISKRI